MATTPTPPPAPPQVMEARAAAWGLARRVVGQVGGRRTGVQGEGLVEALAGGGWVVQGPQQQQRHTCAGCCSHRGSSSRGSCSRGSCSRGSSSRGSCRGLSC